MTSLIGADRPNRAGLTLIEHVALGSDFDGGGTLVEDVFAYPEITELLLQRGLAEHDVRKVLGANHLRLLSEVIG